MLLQAPRYRSHRSSRPEREFRDLQLAVAASAPKPTALDRFIVAHLLVAVPLQTPASLAEEQQRLNAFIFINKEGAKQAVRDLAVPPKVVYLTAENAARREPNFLFDELHARLAKAPITFKREAKLAQPVTRSPMRRSPGRRNARS